jgi:hypothetical protein
MVISASIADSSLGIAITGSLNTAVRLVHPHGDSFVNQREGSFLDGYIGGSPRCHECRLNDGHAAEKARVEQVQQAATVRRDAVGALASVSDPIRIMQLLGQIDTDDLKRDECEDAWRRLVEAGALGDPEHEVVTVSISFRKFWGNPAEERSRIPAWRFKHRLRRTKQLLLLDAIGNIWHEYEPPPGASRDMVLPRPGGDRTEDILAVEVGEEVVMKNRRGGPGWTIETGTPVNPGGGLATAMLAILEDRFSSACR